MGNPMDKACVFFTSENLSRLTEADGMQTILLLLAVHLCLHSQLMMLFPRLPRTVASEAVTRQGYIENPQTFGFFVSFNGYHRSLEVVAAV